MSRVTCYKCDICGKIVTDNSFVQLDPPKPWLSKLKHPFSLLGNKDSFDICSDCQRAIRGVHHG